MVGVNMNYLGHWLHTKGCRLAPSLAQTLVVRGGAGICEWQYIVI